jgi:hypothetical protein
MFSYFFSFLKAGLLDIWVRTFKLFYEIFRKISNSIHFFKVIVHKMVSNFLTLFFFHKIFSNFFYFFNRRITGYLGKNF